MDAVWIVLAVGGIAMLLPLRRSVHAVDPAGALLALGSGVFWALYILFGRRVGRTYGTRGAGLGVIVAAAVFVPLGVARAGPALFTLVILPSGFFLALLSSALPYSLEMAALARIPPRVFGTLMSLEPAVGALAGAALLRESLTPAQWAGVVAVIVASLGTTMTIATPRPPTAESVGGA
jgi:inner membrane transporter RhtA